MEPTWNTRCQESIKKEKAEAEKRYGIRISQTEIYCAWCGKPASFFHICPDMSPERREEIERIKAEYERPWCSWSNPSYWKNKIGIEIEMSKEQALEKFLEWQESMKTCQRCEGDKYFPYCLIRQICREANNVRDNAQRNDNGTGITEAHDPETFRIGFSETRERASVR